MALQDIIQAIIDAADQEIEKLRAEHQKFLTDRKAQAASDLEEKKAEIAASKEKKKTTLLAKTENHASIQKRNKVLAKKQELLDRTYSETVEKLAGASPDKLEPLFTACLQSISEKGTLRCAPAHKALLEKIADSGRFTIGEDLDASGGFVFVSDRTEADFTLTHIVENILRPQTELELSQTLFA